MMIRFVRLLVVFALICVAAACGCTGTTGNTTPASSAGEDISWNLTISDGINEEVLSFSEIKKLPAWEGYGYAVSTVGIKYGPYTVKGVSMATLLDRVGGFGAGDQVGISAPDGYYWVFDDEQMAGKGFVTLDQNLKEKPSPPLTVVLAYAFNGTAIPEGDGGPLRVVVGTDNPDTITEGSAWVKWVNRLEVKRS